MKPWQSMLIGLGIALLMILMSLPITIYMAIDRDDSLKPASLGVFAMWLALIIIGSVGGLLWPRVLNSIDPPEQPRHTNTPHGSSNGPHPSSNEPNGVIKEELDSEESL
ncbi:MAG TPA: hypothetical protein ENJ00_00015 [Phycisphaerales bacterium]|nr:hypothetical protein [Phycisphaerales bacterium]